MFVIYIARIPVSKTLAEKGAWKFTEENKQDIITVIPVLMAGRSLTKDVPSSTSLAMALLIGEKIIIPNRLILHSSISPTLKLF